MRHFVADYEGQCGRRASGALPYMLEAHRRMWEPDIGMDRFIGRAR